MLKKRKKGTYMDAKKLAWKHFYETGEIGAYMLYKKLSEEEDGTDNNKGDSAKID